jgi:hypothetical protein
LRWLAFKFKSRQNRWTALVKKELQLQEVTMVLIPLLALLYLAGLIAHYFAPKWISSDVIFIAVPLLWLVAVSSIIGCVAVAEERRFNTLEGLLCLPMTKRGQFAVKFGVALVLGTVLGGIVPWILAHIGGVRPWDFQLCSGVESAALVTAVAFYASTMSRGLLQAIPTALCMAALVGAAFIFFGKFFVDDAAFARSLVFPALAWPVMTITLICLAFKNYQQLQIGWRLWAGNLIRAGAVAGCVTLTSLAIFDGSWELLLSLEPSHGPARISGPGQASIAIAVRDLCILLPDGRLWSGKKDRLMESISGGFAQGSNWVEVAATYQGAAALRSDGTLWRILTKSDLRQIGFDSDWKKITADGDVFLALKQNGTIWGWGGDYNEMVSEQSVRRPGGILVIPDPIRVGEDSDWVNIFVPRGGEAMGVKRDGTAWRWGYVQGPKGNWILAPVSQKIRWRMGETNWLALVSNGWVILGIRTDGSLWIAGDYLPSKIFGETVLPGLAGEARRVGTKSDWVALKERTGQITALEADSTLWTMDLRGQSKRPSQYADWVAATQNFQFTWGLAKDGTLTCWNVFGTKEHYTKWSHGTYHEPTFMDKLFLGPTRRPILSANILGAP